MAARRWSIWVLGFALAFPAFATAEAAERGLPRVASLRPMESPAPPLSGQARLRATKDGRLLLSWIEGTGAARRLRLSIGQNGKWTQARTIAQGESLLANWADFPNVVELPNGTLLAGWLSLTGDESYEVRIAVSKDAGSTWSKPRRLHQDGSLTEHGFVSFVPRGNGALALWLDGRHFAGAHGSGEHGAGANMTLRAAEIRSDGTVAGEVEVDDRVCDCCQTTAAATSKGVVVAYRDRGPTEIRDISAARFENGKWSKPATVRDDHWEIPGCPVNGPVLSTQGKEAFLAWFTAAENRPRVFAAFSTDDGVTFSDPIPVDVSRPAGRVGALLLPDGEGLVTWLETVNDSTAHLLGRVVSKGGKIGEASRIATLSAARASGVPQVARVGRKIYFAWRDTGKTPRVRMASAELTGGR